jgi:predicted nucleic acid-binding protein
MIVVDASVAVQTVLHEPHSPIAVAALRARPWSAPDLIFPECANIVWKRYRIGEIDMREAERAIDLIEALNMYTEPSRRLIQRAAALSRELQHSAYDCFYLAHAEDMKAPLLTADGKLIAKVRGAGLSVELMSLPEFAKEIGL